MGILDEVGAAGGSCGEADTTAKVHRIATSMASILKELGHDLSDPSLAETPKRVAKALLEFHQPFDARAILKDGFASTEGTLNEMVVQAGIPFRMLCEHHLLPAIGRANVGYIPTKRVVGLSKLTRLVQAIGTEKPSLQEAICDRTAALLEEHLAPRGVMVVISAEHSCMACRGVNSPGVDTVTSSLRGAFRDVQAARQEFFELVKMRSR